ALLRTARERATGSPVPECSRAAMTLRCFRPTYLGALRLRPLPTTTRMTLPAVLRLLAVPPVRHLERHIRRLLLLTAALAVAALGARLIRLLGQLGLDRALGSVFVHDVERDGGAWLG